MTTRPEHPPTPSLIISVLLGRFVARAGRIFVGSPVPQHVPSNRAKSAGRWSGVGYAIRREALR